jgi:hypothetical protein
MKKMKRVFHAFIAMGITLSSLSSYPQGAQTQRPRPADELTVAILHDAGLSLPPGRSLSDQSRYEAPVATHAEVTILWDERPGAPERIPVEESDKWPVFDTLRLENFHSNLPGPPGRINLEMRGQIFIFGLTDANEIRSVGWVADTRFEGTEDGYGSRLRTKIPLRTWFPEDSSITKFGVYEAIHNYELFSLRKIGEVHLSRDKAPR